MKRVVVAWLMAALSNFVSLQFPSGGANFLIGCAVNDCATSCGLPQTFPRAVARIIATTPTAPRPRAP